MFHLFLEESEKCGCYIAMLVSLCYWCSMIKISLDLIIFCTLNYFSYHYSSQKSRAPVHILTKTNLYFVSHLKLFVYDERYHTGSILHSVFLTAVLSWLIPKFVVLPPFHLPCAETAVVSDLLVLLSNSLPGRCILFPCPKLLLHSRSFAMRHRKSYFVTCEVWCFSTKCLVRKKFIWVWFSGNILGLERWEDGM